MHFNRIGPALLIVCMSLTFECRAKTKPYQPLTENKAKQLWKDAVEIKKINSSRFALKNSTGKTKVIQIKCVGVCKEFTCGPEFRLGCIASKKCQRTEALLKTESQ